MDVWVAADGIARHRPSVDQLSDAEFVDLLASVDPLPDQDDDGPEWLLDATFDRLELLLASADLIGERGLVAAIPLIFERAGLGDGLGHMQGIRHGPEQAVGPAGNQLLLDLLLPLTTNPHAGCRRWTAFELGIVGDRRAVPALRQLLSDPISLVREQAQLSLETILGWTVRHDGAR